MTLALWPWPIPWMVDNMSNIVDRRPVDGAAVSVSVGRHLATAFIVPLIRAARAANRTCHRRSRFPACSAA